MLSEIWGYLGYGGDPTGQQEKTFFKECDTNGSGKIGKKELFNYLRRRM